MLLVNNLIGFGVGGGGPEPIVATVIANYTTNPASSTWTLTSVAHGPGRIAVAIASETLGAFTGFSVDGISGTLLSNVQFGGIQLSAMVAYADTTAASGNIVITCSNTIFYSGLTVYSMPIGTITQHAEVSSSSAPAATFNVANESAVIAAAGGRLSGIPTASWTNATADTNYGADSFYRMTTAHNNVSAANPSLSVTCSFSGGATGIGAFAVFSP